jgi:molecular chaperone DnaK
MSLIQENHYGIDLGTTNCCISRLKDGQSEVISVFGQRTMPSVLALRAGEWIVGAAAKNIQMVDPKSAASSIKRYMGDLGHRFSLCGVDLTPIEASAQLLRGLVEEAQRSTGDRIEKVVITVPAWFQENQRQATLAAGKAAGLDVVQIINEPTAAALAYDLKEVSSGDEEHWLVYDLGGGTFDVSVLTVTDSTHEVKASLGNSFLGGDDFDRRLAERLVIKIKDKYNLDPESDPIAMAHLRHAAERAKIMLSDETEVEVQESISIGGKPVLISETFTRSEFEELIRDLIDSSLEKVTEALSESGLGADAMHRLLLVGGSTRIPLIAAALKEVTGLDAEAWVDPDEAVARGAALQAASRAGAWLKRTMVDIAPHSLGIATLGHEDELLGRMPEGDEHPRTFGPVIRRNSRLPAQSVKTFYKLHPSQTMFQVAVYQGESTNTRQNTLIGEFMVPLKNQEDTRVDVRFRYDLNGSIVVGVEEPGHNVLTTYSMDLSKSAEANSQRSGLLVAGEADEDDWDEGAEEGVDRAQLEVQKTSNYLIEKVLSLLALEPDATVERRVVEYRAHLAAGCDDEMDEAEEFLFDWVESKKDCHP